MGDELIFGKTRCVIAIVITIRTGLTALPTTYPNQLSALEPPDPTFCDQQSGVSLHPCQLMTFALLVYV